MCFSDAVLASSSELARIRLMGIVTPGKSTRLRVGSTGRQFQSGALFESFGFSSKRPNENIWQLSSIYCCEIDVWKSARTSVGVRAAQREADQMINCN